MGLFRKEVNRALQSEVEFSGSICSLLGEGNDTPLQYSCLENPMDGGAWWAAVHGVARRQTWLSDFTLTFHFHALEEEMATHSGVLAWRIPWTEESGGLLSLGSHRVGHDWSDLAAAAANKYIRRSVDWDMWPNLCYIVLWASTTNYAIFASPSNTKVPLALPLLKEVNPKNTNFI